MAIRKSTTSGTPFGGTSDRPSSPTKGQTFFNGDTGILEIYNGTSWYAAAAIAPSSPTSVTATNSGSGRAFNNGRASVEFSVSGGSIPTSFTVTSSPGSYTASGSSSPIVITGLQSSTQYTYTVTATNSFGTSSASSASSGITATTVPGTPTSVSGIASGSDIIVSWTAPSTGGSAITGYTVTTYLSGVSQGTTSVGNTNTATISNLNTANTYTFTVSATNANGTGQESSASSSVNFLMPIWVWQYNDQASSYITRDGETWTQISRPYPASNGYPIGNGAGSSIREDGRAWWVAGTSTVNNSTYTSHTPPLNSTDWWASFYLDGKYAVVRARSNVCAYSNDGITWTQGSMPSRPGNGNFAGKFAANGKMVIGEGFYALAQNTGLVSSNYGQTWSEFTFPAGSGTWGNITYGDKWVAVDNHEYGNGQRGATSTDGITWSSMTSPNSNNPTSIEGLYYAQGQYIMFHGSTTTFYTSSNGTSWTSRTFPQQLTTNNYNWTRAHYSTTLNKHVLVMFNNGTYYKSTDGINWTSGSVPQIWGSTFWFGLMA